MTTKKRENSKGGIGVLFLFEDIAGIVLRWIIVVAFLLMIAMMLMQVLTRFVLHVSIPWSEELTRYIWVTICFIASGVAVKYNEHIEIDIVGSILNKIKREESRRRVEFLDDMFRYAVMLVISVYAAYICMNFIGRELATTTQLTPALHLPKWWIDAAICFGWLVAAFYSAIKLVRIVADRVSAKRAVEEGGETSC
jgi:C4-dicarboxylate transporter DctQ subunit